MTSVDAIRDDLCFSGHGHVRLKILNAVVYMEVFMGKLFTDALKHTLLRTITEGDGGGGEGGG